MNTTLLTGRGAARQPTATTPNFSRRAYALAAAAAIAVGLFAGAGIAKATRPSASVQAPRVVSTVPSTPAPVNAGPSHFDGMVPVGYLHNEAGAVAAAASYTAMTTEMVFRTEMEARAAARRIAVPEAADAIEALTMKPIGGIRQTLAMAGAKNPNGRALIRTVPIGTRMVSYGDDRARVDVWSMTYLAVELGSALEQTSDAKPTGAFMTTSYELAWYEGDWKVTAMQSIANTGPALTRAPALNSTPFIDQASGMTPFRYRANRGNR